MRFVACRRSAAAWAGRKLSAHTSHRAECGEPDRAGCVLLSCGSHILGVLNHQSTSAAAAGHEIGICCQTSEAAPKCAPLGRVLDSRFCLRVIVADSIISRCGQRVNVKQIATADEARGEGRNLLTFTRPRGPRTRSIPQGILRGSLLLMFHVFVCCDFGSMLNAARRRRVAAAAAAPAAVADSLTGILFMLPPARDHECRRTAAASVLYPLLGTGRAAEHGRFAGRDTRNVTTRTGLRPSSAACALCTILRVAGQ